MKKSKQKTHSTLENSRRTLRKEKRLLKKVHRKEHYLKKKTEPTFTPGKFVKRPTDFSESEVKVNMIVFFYYFLDTLLGSLFISH